MRLRRSVTTVSTRPTSSRSSASRPTKAPLCPAAPACRSPRVTLDALTDRRLPFSWSGAGASNESGESGLKAFRVGSSTRTPPAGAADCRRAAVLMTSPVTMPCP